MLVNNSRQVNIGMLHSEMRNLTYTQWSMVEWDLHTVLPAQWRSACLNLPMYNIRDLVI